MENLRNKPIEAGNGEWEPPKPPNLIQLENDKLGKAGGEGTPTSSNSVEANSGEQSRNTISTVEADPGAHAEGATKQPPPPSSPIDSLKKANASFSHLIPGLKNLAPREKHFKTKPSLFAQRERATSLSTKRKNTGPTGISPQAKANKPHHNPDSLNKNSLKDNYDQDIYDQDNGEDRDNDWGDEGDNFYDKYDYDKYSYDNMDTTEEQRPDNKGYSDNKYSQGERLPPGNRYRKQKHDDKQLNTEEASKCYDQAILAQQNLKKLLGSNVEMSDVLNLIVEQNSILTTIMELCMSLDKRVGSVDLETNGNLSNTVNTSKVKKFQLDRTISLKDSARSIKIPYVKAPMTDGKVDRKKLTDAVKDHLGEGLRPLISPDVEIIPLRNSPKTGNDSVPVLLKFKTLDICSDFESHCRKEKKRVVPNYSKDNFKMIEAIRAKVVHINPPQTHVMVRPSRNFTKINIKVRANAGTKWTLFTALDIPLSPEEMISCKLANNPGFNSKFPNLEILPLSRPPPIQDPLTETL